MSPENPSPSNPRVAPAITAIAPGDTATRDATEALARRLNLPIQHPETTDADYLLVLTPERLELRTTGTTTASAVYVDFSGGRARHRRLHGGGRRQALARAVGLRPGYRPRIVDATAGLGRDAFVLASLGCTVRLVERSPIVCALLADGVRRAAQDPEIGPWVQERMSWVEADSLDYLRDLTGRARPDVVYLDPMYPERKKSALVKKELRVLRDLVGPEPDAMPLLELACSTATRRVVVKRPRTAPPLTTQPAANTTVCSLNTRYDIYLV